MTIYSDALGKQSTFNTNLIAKLQELATAVGNRVRSADLYDGNGKIKSNLLPFAINDLLEMKGALYLHTFPNHITSGSGTKDGEIYIVTEAATGTNRAIIGIGSKATWHTPTVYYPRQCCTHG
jgi:hypothetical protein